MPLQPDETKRQTSNDNRLEDRRSELGARTSIFAEKQGHSTDGLLGSDVFEDRIVEIDYDAEAREESAMTRPVDDGW